MWSRIREETKSIPSYIPTSLLPSFYSWAWARYSTLLNVTTVCPNCGRKRVARVALTAHQTSVTLHSPPYPPFASTPSPMYMSSTSGFQLARHFCACEEYLSTSRCPARELALTPTFVERDSERGSGVLGGKRECKRPDSYFRSWVLLVVRYVMPGQVGNGRERCIDGEYEQRSSTGQATTWRQ